MKWEVSAFWGHTAPATPTHRNGIFPSSELAHDQMIDSAKEPSLQHFTSIHLLGVGNNSDFIFKEPWVVSYMAVFLVGRSIEWHRSICEV